MSMLRGSRLVEWLEARSERTGLEGQFIELMLNDKCQGLAGMSVHLAAVHMMEKHLPINMRFKFYKVLQDWLTEVEAEEALGQ